MHEIEKHSHVHRFALNLSNRSIVQTLKWSIPDPIQDSNLVPQKNQRCLYKKKVCIRRGKKDLHLQQFRMMYTKQREQKNPTKIKTPRLLEAQVLSTRIRFHLKTQLYRYGFRPNVSDENDQQKRNFSKTLSRVELFENAVFACACGQTKTELFENTENTLSVPIHSAQYQKRIQDDGRALPFFAFYTCAYFQPNFLFSSKFGFDYSRRRQNIIRLLSLPVSRGGRLDVHLV